MNIHIIFAQRKEQYPEQYAPEALECCTEYAIEDGADDWWQKKLDEHKSNPDFVSVKEFVIRFPDAVRVEIRNKLITPLVVETRPEGVVEGET